MVLLPKWEGRLVQGVVLASCFSLQQGLVGTMPRHRCNAKGCQTYINPRNPHHLHPLFVDGKRAYSLQQKAAALLLLLQRVSHVSIHRSLG